MNYPDSSIKNNYVLSFLIVTYLLYKIFGRSMCQRVVTHTNALVLDLHHVALHLDQHIILKLAGQNIQMAKLVDLRDCVN